MPKIPLVRQKAPLERQTPRRRFVDRRCAHAVGVLEAARRYAHVEGDLEAVGGEMQLCTTNSMKCSCSQLLAEALDGRLARSFWLVQLVDSIPRLRKPIELMRR